MKQITYQSFLLISSFLLFSSVISYAQSSRKADKDTKKYRYEIEAVDVGAGGSYLIKVWSYSRNPDIAIEQAKKNAVHGIIFKGFIGIRGVPGQHPLVNSPNVEQEKVEYFNAFFNDGGKYNKFVSLSSDGGIAAGDRLKVGKEYKIGVIVSVKTPELRKELESAGIIKGLNSGF